MLIILKSGREKSLLRGHPWIFSGAIHSVEGNIASGQPVGVYSREGDFLAWAAFSPQSQIRLRVWSFQETDSITPKFIQEKMSQAIARRAQLMGADTTVCRLIHSEADGLPGLIVDRYEGAIVFQLLSAGAEYFRQTIIDTLKKIEGVRLIVERSDADVRSLEGLQPRAEVVFGDLPPEGIEIREHGLSYYVDPLLGHKTGFYLDQRDNRALLMSKTKGLRVLNCFSYTGGFSLAALKGGASEVISIDSSGPALMVAKRQLLKNFPEGANATWMEADVFDALRRFRDKGEKFDCIVLDPPKLAPTASHADRAARAYKDMNLLAFKLLNPGGILMTFSCSGGVSTELFRKIIAASAQDAKVDAFVEGTLSASIDHSIRLSFPEGEYLKGLLLRVI